MCSILPAFHALICNYYPMYITRNYFNLPNWNEEYYNISSNH